MLWILYVIASTLMAYLFNITKIPTDFSKNPPVRDMPRHKLEVIKLLISANEPVETVS